MRLWDPHALDEVLGQFQELRLCYEVTSVDLDRYRLDGRYPELRMVVLMHGDDMSYGPTFAQALEGLVNGRPNIPSGEAQMLTANESVQQANRAFDEYLKLTNSGQFAEAGKQLEILRDTLRKLEGQGGPLPSR